jgi:hypothetical protein
VAERSESIQMDKEADRQAAPLEDQPGICGEQTGRFRAVLNWPAQSRALLIDFSNMIGCGLNEILQRERRTEKQPLSAANRCSGAAGYCAMLPAQATSTNPNTLALS